VVKRGEVNLCVLDPTVGREVNRAFAAVSVGP
jgi:mRNA-degrading endonuclease toxin of MazEF toxin-antitoxin module